MKLLNKALCLVALFAMGSVLAKISGGAGRPGYTGGNAPYAGGGTQEKFIPLNENVEKIRKKTYQPLPFTTNQKDRIVFNGGFLSFIQAFVNGSQLDKNMTSFLLKLARDTNFEFTGNDATDLALLQDSNQQIAFLVSKFSEKGIDVEYTNYLKRKPLQK